MKSLPARRPLTPQNLLLDFGDKAAITRDGVRTLFAALDGDQSAALTRWKTMFGRWAGRAIEKLPQQLATLAARYEIAADPADAARLLFAMQTYYALLVNQMAQHFGRGRIDGSLPGNPFSWCGSLQSNPIDDLLKRIGEVCSRYEITAGAPDDDGPCDLFKPLYQSLFPRPLRRQLGEYYTPDWLAAHVLDQVGYCGQPGTRLLDPACGSGTFLMMALRRWLGEERGERRGERGEGREERGRQGDGETRREGGNDIGEQAGTVLISASPSLPLSSLPSPLSLPIVGFDLNPLAVMTARANLLIALADVLPKDERVEMPVYLYDSILGRGQLGEAGGGTFDFVVGNPPWIAWDNLPEEDRQATKPLWERYGLFSLSGKEARHGGGKKDLSMLMLYAAADRCLKPGGRLGMVITQTLFQTKGAGDGFRRFRLGPDGPPLRVLRVDDMVALRPFGDAANWTSTIVLEKGTATEYPVAYFKWEGREKRGEGRGNDECRMMNDESRAGVHHSSFIIHSCLARPIDPSKPTSPWLISDADNSRGPTARGTAEEHNFSPLLLGEGPGVRAVQGSGAGDQGSETPTDPSSLILHPSSLLSHPSTSLPADYSAHLGANSGGANGVYWVEVFGPCDGGVLIRNLAGRGKHHVETIECVIEPDLLYPLLRWGDVGRYSATPQAYLLLAQDPATRSGIEESIMRTKYPRTLAYLERFRDLLSTRAAYRRYQQGGPFYAMYNVGPYTVAPIKVVWRRMDRRINAVVVEASVTPGRQPEPGEAFALRLRPPIPQETCVLVACDSSDEAHYLCALLNSAAVNELVAAHSVRGGKGFGTPGMFDFLPLRRFRPDDPRHAELAALSCQSHRAIGSERDAVMERLGELPRRIDE